MHRVLLTGGPTLLREAYARIIEDSALLTVQVQIPDLAHALAQLPSMRPDILLIDALALAPSPAPRHCCPCAEPQPGPRLPSSVTHPLRRSAHSCASAPPASSAARWRPPPS